jgi:hypothetical protein
MVKPASASGGWYMYDTMRGLSQTGNQYLRANTSAVESATSSPYFFKPTATGFIAPGDWLGAGETMIYMAIRRGPMKVPTSGTSVLGLNARSGTGSNATVTGSAGVTDLAIIKNRGSATNWLWSPRLTGTGYLSSNATTAEIAAGTTILQANPWDVMDGVKVGTTSSITNASGSTFINYLFKRAPSVFDVCCYTGTGVARTVTHNLTVAPELMIVKRRSASSFNGWPVYVPTATAPRTNVCFLNTTASATDTSYFNLTAPTSTVFSVDDHQDVNASGNTYVAYLFSSCAGVSKVGRYVGTHDTTGPQTINCGFTSGARFVLIKQIGSDYGWWVFDTARGINPPLTGDPYSEFNSDSAESTLDMINPDSSGFIAWREATNIQGVTYIFLAIA